MEEDGTAPTSTNNIDLQRLQAITAALPRTPKDIKVTLNDDRHFTMDLACAQDLAPLLSNNASSSTSLYLDVYDWTLEGFLFLMKELETNDSLQVVSKLTLPLSFLSASQQARTALQNLCENNARIHCLCLDVSGKDDDLGLRSDNVSQAPIYDAESLLGSLTLGLKNNGTLRDLQIEGLDLPTVDGMIEFLRETRFPLGGCITFRRVDIVNENKDYMHEITEQKPKAQQSLAKSKCRIQDLILDECTISPESLGCLIQELAKLETLRYLRIISSSIYVDRLGTSRTILTEALSVFLRDSRIHTLSLHGYSYDHPAIAKALRNNRSLTSFSTDAHHTHEDRKSYLEVLQHHNTTLTHVSLGRTNIRERCRTHQQMNYFLWLNQVGRARARRPGTNMADLLHRAIRDARKKRSSTPRKHRYHPRHYEEKLVNLCYGLLQESPSIWATNLPK